MIAFSRRCITQRYTCHKPRTFSEHHFKCQAQTRLSVGAIKSPTSAIDSLRMLHPNIISMVRYPFHKTRVAKFDGGVIYVRMNQTCLLESRKPRETAHAPLVTEGTIPRMKASMHYSSRSWDTAAREIGQGDVSHGGTASSTIDSLSVINEETARPLPGPFRIIIHSTVYRIPRHVSNLYTRRSYS
ncbi:hypothetical protein FRC02_001388 [Tulasnella sp. 418]|nr:hypothetical protein FRC02_001388 [Tulasnella sp. 418]